MSQRLLIKRSNQKVSNEWAFDAIITEKDRCLKATHKMINGDFFALSPWKISIEDIETYRKFEKLLKHLFSKFWGEDYPECVWVFYYKTQSIAHPSEKELNEFLKTVDKNQIYIRTNPKESPEVVEFKEFLKIIGGKK